MPDEGKDHAKHLDALRDLVGNIGARSVFGEPVRQDDITLLPVARVHGAGCGRHGGGAAGGAGPDATGGKGGGFMLRARPTGAFVIKGGRVCWRPAVDVNKIAMGGQIVMVAALLTVKAILRGRRAGF